MSVSTQPLMAHIARAAWIFGFIAAGLAVAGSLILQGSMAITILRVGILLTVGSGLLGLVTGLLSRSYPSGRRAIVASIVLLAMVVLFILWSGSVMVGTAPPS